MSGLAMAQDGDGGGMRSIYSGSSSSSSDWDSLKRVWRSLVFLDGWLSSSVGFQPSTGTDSPYFSDAAHQHDAATALSPPPPPPLPSCFEGFNDTSVGLQTEMARLGSLMKSIARDVCLPSELDLAKVRHYCFQLETWHKTIPGFLHLSGVMSGDADYTHKTSVLLTHCAYLSAIVLLTKRVLVARIRDSHTAVMSPGTPGTHLTGDVDEFAAMCLSAARQLATVVGLIFQEGRLVRKFWLGIQSAFSSCLMIFLDLALARREQNSLPTAKDTELVSRCLAALEHCAMVDGIAKVYLEILLPVRNALVPGAGGSILSGKLHRPQVIQHHSSGYTSSVSGSSSISRSPSSSPSKRPRLLPNGSPPQGAPTSPTFGTTFQQAGSFSRIMINNRIDQIFASDEGVIDGVDPRIHTLIKYIIECIESPYNQRDKPSGQDFGQAHYAANRRTLDPKSRIGMASSSGGVTSPPVSPHTAGSPCSPTSLLSPPSLHGQNLHQSFPQQQQSPVHVPSQLHAFPIQQSQQTVSHQAAPLIGAIPTQAMHIQAPVAFANLPTKQGYTVMDAGGAGGGDSRGSGGGRRRKIPFKSMEEYENFLRRVA